MKKLISMLLVIATVSLLLCACGQNGDTSKTDETSQTTSESGAIVSNASCIEIRDEAYTKEKSDPEVHQLYDSKDSVMDEFLISGYYGTLLETPDFTKLDSYAIFITDEPVVSEFGVFKASEEMSVDEIKEFCQLRVDALKKKFEGYKPEMVNAAKGSVIGVYGDYVYYISTMENNTAIETIIKTKIDAGKQ
jgi:hypothetical protein